jgi:cell division transport system permease protein
MTMKINRPAKSKMAQRTSTAADSPHAKQINQMFADPSVPRARFWHQWGRAIHRAKLTRRRQWQDSWRRLRSKPWSNVLLIVMLGAILFLPLAFYLVFQNVMTLQQSFDGQPTASLFLHDDALPSVLAESLRQRPGVLDAKIIHKEEGLEQLRQASGFSQEWLTSLESNPLPEVIVLTLDTAAIHNLDQFREQLAALPQVEHVTLDVIWLQRLGWLVTLLQRIAWLLTGALALVVILTIGNTIRLTVENARDEIQVGWLVGASQSFLRRPFLYMGALYGLFGAIAALLLVVIAAWWVHEPVQALLVSYTAQASALPMVGEIVLALLIISSLLGWLGARLAVNRVLAKMLPEAR